MGCMKNWLRSHGADNADVDDSRGEKRKEFLLSFLVQQMRDKKAKKEVTTEKKVSSSKETE
eukprot:6679268-Pyramimonas_sp.AAC.1